MRCSTARRLMLLYRDGELSPESLADLTHHYVSCATCAREAKDVAADFAPIEDLRRLQPVLDAPRALTLRIMREVESQHQPFPLFASSPGPLERLFPALRAAGAAAAGVLTIVYVALSYNDAQTLASLEKRLEIHNTDAGSAAAQLAHEAVSELENRSRSPYDEAGMRPAELRRALEFLFTRHREHPQVTVGDVLLGKYPGLASVTLQDGLDDSERAVLATEGERFLKDLEKLIRKENTTHEP